MQNQTLHRAKSSCVCIMRTHACAYILKLYIMTLNCLSCSKAGGEGSGNRAAPLRGQEAVAAYIMYSFISLCIYSFFVFFALLSFHVISFLLPVLMCILRDKRKGDKMAMHLSFCACLFKECLLTAGRQVHRRQGTLGHRVRVFV